MTHAALLTKTVREPEKLTAQEIEALGDDLDMAIKILELQETELIAEQHALACGRSFTAKQRARMRRAHDDELMKIAGVSKEFRRKMHEVENDIA